MTIPKAPEAQHPSRTHTDTDAPRGISEKVTKAAVAKVLTDFILKNPRNTITAEQAYSAADRG